MATSRVVQFGVFLAGGTAAGTGCVQTPAEGVPGTAIGVSGKPDLDPRIIIQR